MSALSYHIRKVLWGLAATIMFCMVAVSCSDEEKETLDTDDVKVAFSLSVADATLTRATNDGWNDYAPGTNGTEDENRINPNDLLIKICNAEGNAIASVEDLHITRVNDTNGTRYDITGTWKNARQLLDKASKVMVIANCGATTRNEEDINELSFTLDNDSRKYIPMWGMAPLPKLVPGSSNSLNETIYMLRAMAKVSVRLREDMENTYGYSIGSLKIVNYNTKGYCLPRNFENVERTGDIKFANSLHVFDSRESGLDFSSEKMAYLTEYDNTSANATPSEIKVTLSKDGKTEGPYTLFFRNYDMDGAPTGTPYDIQRNHFYQYTIYKESDKIIVTLHVRKWNLREYGDDIIM